MSDKQTKNYKEKVNPPAETEKGILFVVRDLERIRSKRRHIDSKIAVSEAKRLAGIMGERMLILRVVGVVNKRKKKTVDTPAESVV